MSRVSLLVLALCGIGLASVGAEEKSGPLKPWTRGVKLSPVLKDADCHSFHTYFNTSPESPDGRWVLLFTSTDPRGQKGEVALVERATGALTVLARDVTTEDAHRVAYQQWLSGGRRVVYQDLRDGQWVIVAVDIQTREAKVLAKDRQVAFGTPKGDLVPIYGPHWNPGKHRDLELLNVATGEIRTVLTAEAVKKAYPEWVAKEYGERPISIFFPLLSPDGERVIFKIATPLDGGFQTKRDSQRDGLICYDLHRAKFLWMQKHWYHPAWNPAGRGLINIGPVLVDDETGTITKLKGFPAFPGSHPSLAPDGRLFTTDAIPDPATATVWSVVVGDTATGEHQTIHRFENGRGAASWRRSHPHPSFSPDGKRLYFNVSSDRWTRLFVAQCGE
jgi:hypothetical protein